MRIVIAGAHGQIARRLGRLLSGRGDTVVGIIRNPDHAADLAADGVEPGRSSTSSRPRVDDVAAVVAGADAVVFAAGAGPGQRRRPQGHRRPRRRGPARRRRRAGRRPPLPAGLLDGRGAGARRGTPRGHGRRSSPPTCRPSCAAEDESSRAPGAGHDGRCAPAGSPTTRAPAGSPWGTARARRASRATTSPPCWSRCSTPRTDGAVVELVERPTPIAEAVAALP